jgi:predicted anti-sigma-YlaC factor YlaD
MTDDLTPDVDAGVTADVDGGGVITQPVAGRTIWRRVGKAAVLVVVGAIVIFVLFTWVFPWVHANGFDPTMDA